MNKFFLFFFPLGSKSRGSAPAFGARGLPRGSFLLLSFFVFCLVGYDLYADSCPHCYKSYGQAAPGDESRVDALRRNHESSCSARSSSSSSSSQNIQTNHRQRAWERKFRRVTEFNKIGIKYDNKKDYDNAIVYYKKALNINPNDNVIQNNLRKARAKRANKLGNSYYRKGNWQEAVRCYKEALRYNEHKVYRDNLAKAISKLEQEQEEEREEEREKQQRVEDLQQAKQNIHNILDDLSVQVGRIKAAPVSAQGPGLDFLSEPGAERIGNRHTNTVDLAFLESDKVGIVDPQVIQKGSEQEKGLIFKEVPPPAKAPSMLDDIRRETGAHKYTWLKKTQIVLDAIEAGNGNWDKSVEHLEKYLKEFDPYSLKVKESLSYIEGMRAGAYGRGDFPKKKGSFVPDKEDSSTLIEAIAGDLGKKDKKNKQVYSEEWKKNRTTMLLEALDYGKGDWDKSLKYLEDKSQSLSDTDADTFFAAKNACSYLKGIHGQAKEK